MLAEALGGPSREPIIGPHQRRRHERSQHSVLNQLLPSLLEIAAVGERHLALFNLLGEIHRFREELGGEVGSGRTELEKVFQGGLRGMQILACPQR